jgi:carboxyl-terminal processing protease
LSSSPKRNVWLPLLVFSALAMGYLLGSRNSESPVHASSLIQYGKSNAGARMQEFIDYITREYVDTIDADSITDMAIEAVLNRLDPHSQFIPASDFDFAKEAIEGNFEGIGVEFQIFHDTIFVTSVIKGGPAEKAGLIDGDRIIAMNGKSLVKKGISNAEVLKSLRGPAGTKVRLQLLHPDMKPLKRPAEVMRGNVPYYSVHHALMPEQTGYIKILHFSVNTGREVREALTELKKAGMKRLVVDVRGNPGGVLQSAVEVCDEFLDNNKMITYTFGKARKRQEFRAEKKGMFETGPLVILIDENAASASEIFAGAIQDHDRGLICGRRSFGKGLVQEQSRFSDGSGMRLTIARYYTPSGRCIQKPYKPDDAANYHEEEWLRIQSGELFHADSIPVKGLPVFKTGKGRKVYGGGGIIPDLFVPLDTGGMSRYHLKISSDGSLNEAAFRKAEALRHSKERAGASLENLMNQSDESLWMDLQSSAWLSEKASPNGLRAEEKEKITADFKALTARYLSKDQAYYQVSVLSDECYKKAVEQLLTPELVR